MGCKNFGISQVLVGLYRVGVTGLAEALKAADESGISDRRALLDLLIEILGADNYIPETELESYRSAIWREYLRHRGEDFSDFYSEVDAVIRGVPGEDLFRFVEMTKSVFGEFELKPNILLEPPGDDGAQPQLVLRNDTIVRGAASRAEFKAAVRKSFSDW